MGTVYSHHKEIEVDVKKIVGPTRKSHGDMKGRLEQWGESLQQHKYLTEEQTHSFYELTKEARRKGLSDSTIDQYITMGRNQYKNGGVSWQD